MKQTKHKKLKAKKYAKGKKIKDLNLSDLDKLYDMRYYNRGRPPLEEPNNRDYHILEALRDGHSMAEVGRVYGLSRQYIFIIKNRWPEYAPKRKKLTRRI